MDNDSFIGKRESLDDPLLARSSTAELSAVNRMVVGSNPTAPVWKDGRAVECIGLENRSRT